MAGLLARLLVVVAEATPITGPRVAAAIATPGVVLLASVAVGTALAAGVWLGLPGAPAFGGLLAGLGVATMAIALLTGHRRRAAQYLAAGGFAVLVMWVSVVGSRARIDFYVEMGHDLRARGDLRGSVAAFDTAVRDHGGRAIAGRPARPLPARPRASLTRRGRPSRSGRG